MVIIFPTTPDRTNSPNKRKGLSVRSLKSKHEYASTQEVADYLGFATRTITAMALLWVESGGTEGLPAIKMGKRKWAFDPEQIQKWVIDRQKITQSAAKTA